MVKSINEINLNLEDERTGIIYVDEFTSSSLSHTSIYKVAKNLIDEISLDQNSYVGLFMNYNLYLASIIISLNKMKCPFIFLNESNCKQVCSKLHIKYVLSLENKVFSDNFTLKRTLEIADLNFLYLWESENRASRVYQDIFCIMQTSGSTGEPKFVYVENFCIEDNAVSLSEIFKIDSSSVIFWGTPLTFDPMLIEFLMGILNQACLLITDQKSRLNPNILFKILFRNLNRIYNGINVLQIVPSLFFRWSESQIKEIMSNSHLKILAFGGEPFPDSILDYKPSNSTLRIFNLYGITELSCWASCTEIKTKEDIHIGSPLPNTTIQVKNHNEIISEGEGEIFLGSSKRFCFLDDCTEKVKNPLVSTGDMASVHNNQIIFKGRLDGVIKRFGYRIKLNQIEAEICKITQMKSICVWKQATNQLLAFFVGIQYPNDDVKRKILDKCRIKLLHTLPEEMFPDYFDIIPKIPLSTHGKINRKALLDYHTQPDHKEKRIDDIFRTSCSKYLGIDSHQFENSKKFNFFEIGGNSIYITQLMNELKMEISFSSEEYEIFTDIIFNKSLENCIDYLKMLKGITTNQTGKRQAQNEANTQLNNKKIKIENEMEILWKYNLKACVDSSPVHFQKGNTTYVAVGSFSHIFAVFTESGEIVYKTTLPDAVEASPCISDCKNFLYVGCFDGNVYCIDYLEGKIRWTFKTEDRIKCTPCCIANNYLVFGSYDKNIYCVDSKNGKLLWKKETNNSITSSPIYQKGIIINATLGGVCYGLNETGEELWKQNLNSPIFGTPCFLEQQVIIPCAEGKLVSLKSSTGAKFWEYINDSPIFSSIKVNSKKEIVFGSNSGLCILQATTENYSLLNKAIIDNCIVAAPALIDDSAFIIAPCKSGKLIMLNENYEELSSIQLPEEIFSSPSVIKNRIFVGCRDNHLYCLEIKSISKY